MVSLTETRTQQQWEMINTLLESEEGRQKLTASLVPSIRRRGSINIQELLTIHDPGMRPGNLQRLAQVLRDAVRQSGIGQSIKIAAVRLIPSAEWVEAWINPGISST